MIKPSNPDCILIQMKHIGSQYQPSHDKAPITKQYEAITLNPLTDLAGLHRAYARDNGIYIRHTIMFVAGTKDFPQDHWDVFLFKNTNSYYI